jgi:hypothetical protein
LKITATTGSVKVSSSTASSSTTTGALVVTGGVGIGGATNLGGPVTISSTCGFNGTAPIAKPTVTGSRGGNAALASLLTALANYGLITDSSSA